MISTVFLSSTMISTYFPNFHDRLHAVVMRSGSAPPTEIPQPSISTKTITLCSTSTMVCTDFCLSADDLLSQLVPLCNIHGRNHAGSRLLKCTLVSTLVSTPFLCKTLSTKLISSASPRRSAAAQRSQSTPQK